MPRVTVVESRRKNENAGPHNALVESDLAFLAADRQQALDFVATHPEHGGSEYPWCWYVYDVELGDPKAIPHDILVMGRDGRFCASQGEAWEAFASAPTPGR